MKSIQQKKKTNPLPKSLRPRKRYLAVLVSSQSALSSPDVVFAILSNQRSLFGSIGLGRQKLRILTFNSKTGFALVLCAASELSDVKAGLLLLSSVKGTPVRIEIRLVSGSLAKVKERVSNP